MDFTQLGLTLITSFIGVFVKRIYSKIEKAEQEKEEEKKTQEALRKGLCSILRNSILHGCIKYIECGSKPMYEINNIGSMYDAYHALGGNGSVTRMYKIFSELPIKEKDEHETQK